MKVRIIGNNCSGKTTVARKLSEYFKVKSLHIDSIAFIPNTSFVEREESEVKSDISKFINENQNWILEGNYISLTKDVFNIPELIIFIDIPEEQCLNNFEKRWKRYQGVSRPELPNLIETDKSALIYDIKSYPNWKDELTKYILQEQIQNPFVHILHLEDMGEVEALCNNPSLIEELFI